MKVNGVSSAVATKVLHRKRRNLIPMLDSVMAKYYEDKFRLALGQAGFLSKMIKLQQEAPDLSGGTRRAAQVLKAFRDDLIDAKQDIDAVQTGLDQDGYHLSLVRILETLIWIEVEPQGYYRKV